MVAAHKEATEPRVLSH